MDVKTLYLILGIMQIFFITSFILSVRASMQLDLPGYIRHFYLYPAVALVMIIFFWLDYFKITAKSFFSALNFFSLSFHFIFLSWFIFKVIQTSGSVRFGYGIRVLFVGLVLGCMVYDYINRLQHTYVLANGLLFLSCLIYFGRLFKNHPNLHLISQPEFWIITGIFLGMGITLPFYIFHEFLGARVNSNTANLLGLIGGIGYATMHLFFIKGFLVSNAAKKFQFNNQ